MNNLVNLELSINVKNIIYKIMITSTAVTRLSCYGILMRYIMKSQILNINPFTHIDKTGGWISFKKNVYSARLKRIVKDELLCESWNLLNAMYMWTSDCVIAWRNHAYNHLRDDNLHNLSFWETKLAFEFPEAKTRFTASDFCCWNCKFRQLRTFFSK